MSCKSRPKCSETEEDLLELQKQFLASKEKSSVKLIKAPSENTKKDSKELSSDKIQSFTDTVTDDTVADSQDVLQDIKERATIDWPSSPLDRFCSDKGFPAVHSLYDEKITTQSQAKAGNKQKKSLFAQQFESLGAEKFGLTKKTNPLQSTVWLDSSPKRDLVDPMKSVPINIPNPTSETTLTNYDRSVVWERFVHSSLVTGDGLLAVSSNNRSVKEDVRKIHEESVAQLSKMTEEELLMEQRKLKQQLGHQLVQFLTSRNKPQVENCESKVINEPSQDNESAGTKWLHMDKVEKEKLKWMEDIDNITTKQETCHEVRFSMDGTVIRRSTGATLPAHLGLHHHGDEPDAAGYTLKELVRLSCSLVLQQRSLSLKTLAIIFKRARHNEYVGVIEGSTMEVLLESSLPKILRYALDDSAKNIQTEAVHGIHSLLVSSFEEGLLDTYTCCYQGLFLPRSSGTVPSDNSQPEMDDEVVKRDVVRGYLQMTLLPRLRYILEMCQPPLELATMIMDIIIVIARHSPYAANKVLTCPRLVKVVIEQFLPSNHGKDSQNPHPKAMKLVRTLCASGKNAAQTLVSTYNILEPILRYCVIHPSAHCIPPNDAHLLYVESAKTWTVLLTYGLTTDTFSDIFPTLLQLLSSHPPSLSSTRSEELFQSSAITNLLTASVHVSAVTLATLGTRPHLSLSWVHAQGLLDPALSCLTSVIREIQHFKDAKDCSLDRIQYIASVQHLVATYFAELSDKPELRQFPVDLLHQVESLVSSVLIQFVESPVYTIALESLSSCLEATPTAPPSPSSLPVLIGVPPSSQALFGHTSLNEPTSQMGVVHAGVMVFGDLLRSHFRLVQSFLDIHKGTANQLLPLLCSEKIMQLIKSFARLDPKQASWYLIPVYYLLDSIIRGFVLLEQFDKTVSPAALQSVYSCVFKMLSLLPSGMEATLLELMSTVMFHPLFYRSVDKSGSLISKAVSLLPSISSTYLQCLNTQHFNSKAIARSLFWSKQNPLHIDTLQLPSYSRPHLPINWPFLPLMIEYKRSQSGNTSDLSLPVITHSLHFVLLLERVHDNIMNMIPAVDRIVGIMCVFLTGADLFLNETIRSLLEQLLLCYSSLPVDFASTRISCLPSFSDLFVSLLEQYSAVSYGDELFARYILLAIRQNQSVVLRRLFWLDHTHITSIFTVGLNKISFPIDTMLYPVEMNWDLVQKYLQLLVSESVIFSRTPVLYVIAVHHVHHYIFNETVSLKLRHKMLNYVLNVPDKSLCSKILLYLKPCQEAVKYADRLSFLQEQFIRECGYSIPEQL